MSSLPHVLAHHAHVFPQSINPNGTIDRLLRLLDACGIDGAVCFAPFPHQLDRSGLDPLDWLAKELKPHPRLYGFGTIDFRRRDLRDQVRRAAGAGFRGLKLHPNAQEFDILEQRALEVYEAAQEADLFLTFHSGVHHYRIRHYNVLSFDEVAYNFPNLRVSLEHVGGYSFFDEALAVIVNNIPFPPKEGRRPRVFGGLTSVFTPHYNRFWYMPRERLIEAFAQAGAEQLIFGLDFPYNLEDNTKLALQTLRELRLSDADLALVLGGNLRRELRLGDEPLRVAAERRRQTTSAAPD
ncbi:MAG TPA: amidohydrolase family protein [Tepidisphaeraceae bacterium]|nr:amidohydrolase family protein [Tepidisphaeraceae bacterium]